MSVFGRGFLALSFVLLSACATFKRQGATDSHNSDSLSQAQRADIGENEVSSEDVEKNIAQPYKSAYGEIALDYNKYVDNWVRYFQGRGRGYMEQYLSRSGRYLPMMKNVLRENGLPEDLVYIALIESGFSPRAHSHANAVGYWQFIRGTGKRFGLKLDTFIDERRDPVLSTRAAAAYFKDLYNMFGSWHLAMASYNVGENRVKRAVAKYYTRDFWELLQKKRALPRETRNYVPKFIAATLIAKNPEKYGFTSITYQDPLSYDTVALTGPISLAKLANNLNVEVEELKLLNPKFRTDFVPIARGSETVVRIPVGRANDALAALSLSASSQPKILRAEYHFYRIRRGDNLSTIARRHRTTVSQLRRLNNLSNRSLLRVGRTLKIPDYGGDGIRYVEDTAAARQPSNRNVKRAKAVDLRSLEYHIVRRGENLTVIARRYGITIQSLLKLNKLSSRSVIRRGQKLRVKAEESPTSASSRPSASKANVLGRFESHSMAKKSKRVVRKESVARRAVGAEPSDKGNRRHVVRRGETLYELAKRYRISMSKLARANGVKASYRVLAGERLQIPD